MSEQGELFARLFATEGAGFRPASGVIEPSVWVKCLLLLREWKPDEASVIQRISLQPGLNILWARPRKPTGTLRLGEQGVFGHASGKTTFCRLLRYVLGERHFGNSDLQTRVRRAFRGGWVVGEVRIKGESWLICRPFTLGAHPFAVRGVGLDRLFDEGLPRERLEVFVAALNEAIIEPLPVATFATAPEPIGWPHLIQWLARDQECRFAELTDFRHKSSGSESPDMDVEDRHFLFRAVLGLIDTAEQAELEKNKELLTKKQAAEKRAPLIRHQATVTYQRLKADLGDEHASLEGELFLATVQKEFEKEEGTLNRTIRALAEPEELKAARRVATNAAARVQNKDAEIKELNEALVGLKLELDVLQGKKPQKEIDDFWRSRSGGSKLCLEPLVRARAYNCPLSAGKVIPADEGKAAVKIEPKAEDIEKAITEQQKQIARLEKTKLPLAVAANDAQKALATAQLSFDKSRDGLFERRLVVRNFIRRASEALEDSKEAETLEASLSELEKAIRLSRDKQAVAREKQKRTLSQFSETFDRVAKAILGTEVTASAHFDGRQMTTTMSERGDLTSAAIETLKILAFDLAAMISAVEGKGFHPRLLIHDGPREADMAVDLYQKIFLLVRELEKAFAVRTASFQYIITTTEPPPEELRDSPWLIDPVLDASTKEGRLFKEDL